MAIFTPGPLAGQISGSLGSVVFSHNKGGAYMRNRVTPTKATSEYAVTAKARMTTASQAWQGLTDDQQTAWREWAKTNPIMNAIGQSRIVAGHVSYIRINILAIMCGVAALTEPPVTPAPGPLIYLALSADIGAGTFDVTFQATPLGATEKLMVWAALVDSKGIKYVENLYKLVTVSAAEQASPLDIQTAVEARFGTISVDQVLHVNCQIIDQTNCLPSSFVKDSAVVVTT